MKEKVPQEDSKQLEQKEALKAFQDIVENRERFIGKELVIRGYGDARETTKKKIGGIQIGDDAMQFIIEGDPGGEFTVPSLGTKVSMSESGFSIESDPYSYSCSS